MAINFDGRHELRFNYTTIFNTIELQHRHTIDVRIPDPLTPGMILSGVDVDLWNGSTLPLPNVVSQWAALLQPFFHTGSNLTHAELWEYEEGSTDALYIGTIDIGLPGTSAIATVAAQQTTMTFRTAGGSIMRVQLMETTQSDNVFQAVPWSIVAGNAIRTLLTGTAHGFQGRDNTKPVAGIRFATTQNEKLQRRRFRP